MVKTFSNTLQPLNWRYPIVDRNGCATLEFQRAWAQQQRANASIPDLTDADAVSVVVDTLSNQYGSIIYRSFDKWLGLPPGKDTQVLTIKKGVPTYADAAPVVPSLDEGKIFVGDASNTAAQVNMSGDATIADSGAVTVVSGFGGVTDFIAQGVALPSGLAASPSLTFSGDLDTGLFSPGANQIGLAIGGATIGKFNTNGLTVSIPGGSFAGNALQGEGLVSTAQSNYGTTSGNNRLTLSMARGTIASPSSVAQNDEVARILAGGYGTSTFEYGARVSATVIEPSPSNTAMGMRWGHYVAPLGSVALTEVLRLEAAKQNLLGPVKIGSISATPDASALLDLQSTTQGFLPPRMTTTQRNAISSPANGLVVYDSTVGAFYFRQSSAWVKLADVQALLDLIGNTQGDVLYRGASSWAALAPGTSGQFLKTQGAGANPVWDTPSGGSGVPHPGYVSGRNYTMPITGLTGKIIANSTLYTHPFFVGASVTFTKATVRVTGAGSAGSKFRFGLYAHDAVNACPGALIGDFGEFAGDSTGEKQATGLSLSLSPNTLYWPALIGSITGGSVTIEGAAGGQGALMAWWLGGGTNTVPVGYVATGVTYGALPDPWPDTTPSDGASQTPLVFFAL